MSGELRPSQRAILDALDRHVLVAAGAGAGKTYTVVRAMLHRLGIPVLGAPHPSPIALDDMAAITFTVAAAGDLVKSLRGALREAGAHALAEQVDGARVGTIHSFCGDLLRSFGLRGRRGAAGALILEGEAQTLLETAARDTLLAALDAPDRRGLDPLLGRHSDRDVIQWLATLAGDGRRLSTLQAIDDPMRRPEHRALLTLAAETRTQMDALLADLPATDFERLLTWSRDLLEVPDALAAARRRIRLLVVDEFQDVDPVQRDIVFALGGIRDGAVDATRLLLVGDPKQSIYRFRGADVTVWRTVEETFASLGDRAATLPLNDSFRSVPAILGFVDHILGDSMGAASETKAPYEVAYAALIPIRDAYPAGPPPVQIIGHAPGDGKRAANAIRAIDAEVVAERLKALHGQPIRLDKPDSRLAWSDMAILVPAWGAVDHYADACRAAGVPAYVLRSSGLLEAREVIDSLLALRVARDPADASAWIGVLRSPFVGLRDDSLQVLAVHGGVGSDAGAPHLPDAERERLASARALFARAALVRDRIPAHELLERLLDESGYRAGLARRGDLGASQAIANLARFAAMLAEEPARSVGGWLRELADRRSRGDDVAPARLVGAGEPLVTITSIHQSKGLDWEVVVWADLQRTVQAEKGVAGLFTSRGGFAIKDREGEPDAADAAALKAIQDEIAREAAAERLRLRYVAATRAKSVLIVSGVALKASKGTDAKWLTDALGLGEDAASGIVTVTSTRGVPYPVDLTVVPADREASDVAESDEAPIIPDDGAVPTLRATSPVPMGRLRHSATALMAHARCERRYAWRYLLGVDEPAPTHAPARDAEAASERGGLDVRTQGTLVHDVLARMEEREDLDAVLRDVESDWSEDAPAPGAEWSDDERATIRAQADAALAGPYGALSARSGAKRELRFLRVLPNGSAIEGALDLAAPDGDGIAIVDVKTGRVAPGDESVVAARYAVQRDVYAEAVAAISGRAITRFDFVFTESGTLAAGPAAPLNLGEAVSKRVSDLEAAAPERAALARDAATCRWCGYRSAGWCEGIANSSGVTSPADG